MTRYAIQYTDDAPNQTSATTMLDGLALQVDYLGGRVIEPSPAKPSWRIQAFFDDAPDVDQALLPDGCRRCILTAGVARSLRLSPR